MKTIKAEVVQAVKMRPGSTLDGVKITETQWVDSGVHEFETSYVTEHRLIDNGYIVALDRPACCS